MMAPLYLSRCRLNLRDPRVQHDLQDCCGLHQRILLAFPLVPGEGSARSQMGVLYRMEMVGEQATVLVQSQQSPNWSHLPPTYLGHPVDEKRLDVAYASIAAGMRLRFRLRANPTKRISAKNLAQGEQWRGKRVELTREEDQIDWLRRRGAVSGFALQTVQLVPTVAQVHAQALVKMHGQRQDASKVTLGTVLFEGLLQITDLEAFHKALVEGLGPGKAYGCGLLSIARA